MHCELMLCLPSVEEKWGVAPIAAERGRGPVVVLPQGVPLDLELVPELLLARGAVEGDLRDLVGVVVDVPDVLAVPHLAWRGPGRGRASGGALILPHGLRISVNWQVGTGSGN